MNAYECMIGTAQCLANNLGGEMRDERQSVMTGQTIEHGRQRVREFERKQLSVRELVLMGESIPADVVERVNGLHRQLNEASYRYYVLDDPTLPDAEYDRFVPQLQTLEARFSFTNIAGVPTQRVGSRTRRRLHRGLTSATHALLDNAFSDAELAAFDKRVRERIQWNGPLQFVAEPKLDGTAINLTYENGTLVRV